MTKIKRSSIILLFLITACSTPKQIPTDVTKPEAPQTQDNQIQTNGPTDFQGIADILGCMFAPQTCEKN